MKTHRPIAFTLLCLALMAAPTTLWAADNQPSEFLDIHPELKPDPERPGALEWQKPGYDRAKYNKLMIAPLVIFVDPQSEYKGFSTDDMQTLANGFRDTVVRVLEPEIPVVSDAGPGVLYVRASITHVKLKKAARGLLGYTPIGLIVTAAQDAAGKRVSMEDATLELEAYDAATGEPLAVIVESRPKGKATGKEELSWKSIEDTFVFYATRLKARILATQKKPE